MLARTCRKRCSALTISSAHGTPTRNRGFSVCHNSKVQGPWIAQIRSGPYGTGWTWWSFIQSRKTVVYLLDIFEIDSTCVIQHLPVCMTPWRVLHRRLSFVNQSWFAFADMFQG
jgi:hypothetical protein